MLGCTRCKTKVQRCLRHVKRLKARTQDENLLTLPVLPQRCNCLSDKVNCELRYLSQTIEPTTHIDNTLRICCIVNDTHMYETNDKELEYSCKHCIHCIANACRKSFNARVLFPAASLRRICSSALQKAAQIMMP